MSTLSVQTSTGFLSTDTRLTDALHALGIAATVDHNVENFRVFIEYVHLSIYLPLVIAIVCNLYGIKELLYTE